MSFPMFGSAEDTGYVALSSGGRSLLVSNGMKHYKIKGADLTGELTKLVGSSKKNVFSHVRNRAQAMVKSHIATYHHENGYYKMANDFLSRSWRPFGFLTQEEISREYHAIDCFSSHLESLGYNAWGNVTGIVEYPHIRFDNDNVYAMVIQIPSIESDLRLSEVYHHVLNSVQSKQHDVQTFLAVTDLVLNLATWYGFSARLHQDHDLCPSEESDHGSNYTLFQVTNEKIGMMRVDHSDTAVDWLGVRGYTDQILAGRFSFASMIEMIGYDHFEVLQESLTKREVRVIGDTPKLAKRRLDRIVTAAIERGFYDRAPVAINTYEFVELMQ